MVLHAGDCFRASGFDTLLQSADVLEPGAVIKWNLWRRQRLTQLDAHFCLKIIEEALIVRKLTRLLQACLDCVTALLCIDPERPRAPDEVLGGQPGRGPVKSMTFGADH
jgi:hypothetical protein